MRLVHGLIAAGVIAAAATPARAGDLSYYGYGGYGPRPTAVYALHHHHFYPGAYPTVVYQPVRAWNVPVTHYHNVVQTQLVPVTTYQTVRTLQQVPVVRYETVEQYQQVPVRAYQPVQTVTPVPVTHWHTIISP